MNNMYTFLKRVAITLWLLIPLGFIPNADAIPLYARQTALKCASCHTIFPELTPFGRKFKLGGYTLGEREKIPLALMTVISANSIRNNTDKSTGEQLYGKNREAVAEVVSLFSGGKFTENAGGFVQWTYENLVTNDDHEFHHHGAIDNVDLRLVKMFGPEEKPSFLGLTLHNNPTVQDVFNTVPAWSYPYYAPSVAAPGLGPTTFLESGSRVAGLGAYAYVLDSLYLEATSYQTAKGALSVLRSGTAIADRVTLSGSNPYWRVAYTFGNDQHNFSIGHFGAIASVNTPDQLTPGDRFRDLGFDMQYQYFSKDDHHIITAQASTISERAEWRTGFPNASNDNPTSHLRSTRAKVTYLLDRTYGITGAVFNVSGDADFTRFGTNNGKPDTSGYIVELNYWPNLKFNWDPQMNVRFGLQYTGYTKFNGSKTNYDGTLRDAKDNNTLYLYAWLMF